MSILVLRLRALWSSAWSGAMRLALENPEQGIILNRLSLALAVVLAAASYAHFGGGAAQDYFRVGLPLVTGYVLLVGLIQADLARHPAPDPLRRTLSVCIDAAVISFGLRQGGETSAYLAPLYFWMILGYGVRLGAAYMGAAVACSAIGFAWVIWRTPFWREHAAFSAGLFCALIIIPAYGAMLLARLHEARSEAERANRAKTQLLANVSHELRTPLTAILGLGDMLKQTRLDSAQQEMVQTLSGAGEILLRHIEALLSVSRDEIGQNLPRPEPVDLFALLSSLRAMLAVEADKKGVRLGLCVEANAPRRIFAEPGLLLDLLQNLGGNAVKFTDAGAVAIHVRASAGRDGDILLRFEVRDTGIGVDAADQERIFEAFVQAGPDIAPRFGGSGLGLAIARRRLEARGGRIGVESELGKGALFWFELEVGRDRSAPPASQTGAMAPALRWREMASRAGSQRADAVCLVSDQPFEPLALARRFAICVVAREGDAVRIARAQRMAASLNALSAGASTPEADAAFEARAPRQPGRRVLLAEDNGVNRKILVAILTGGGFETTAVADGHAALDAMLNERFDVVLLDLNLPKISGLDAARLYRFGCAEAARALVLALTADASPERAAECAEAGFAACLTKPISPASLLAAVDRALLDSPPPAKAKPSAAARPESASDRLSRPERSIAPESLDALARLGGEDFLRDLIAQFIAEGEQIAERMVLAVEQGDLAAFRHEAHALESSAGNIGAVALARLCRSWRAAAPDAFVLYGDDYLDDLRGEWTRAAEALEQALARRHGSGERAPRRRGAGGTR